MSGSSSRNKGQRGEREVIKLLQPIVDKVCEEMQREVILLERNLMQSHRGGFDIVGLEWLALEVKFQETLNIESWWDQAKRQAAAHQEPILFYRKSRAKWRVKMYGILPVGSVHVRTPVDIDLNAFLIYFEYKLKQVI